MTALSNTASGGTDGDAVTTANSGGGSGDAWSSVSKPAGTAIAFSAAGAYSGALGYSFTQGSVSGTGANVRWSVSGWTQLRHRFYFKTAANPSVGAQLAYVTDSGGSNVRARVILTTAGNLGIQDAAGTTLFSSGPIPLNTWVRVEWVVAPGTTSANGTIRFGWAAGDAAIAAGDLYQSTSANVGTTALGTVYVGKLAGTWNTSTYADEFAADNVSSAAFIGPITTAPAPAPAAPVSSSLWPPDPYRQAIRGSTTVKYSVSAAYGDTPVVGATDLSPTGGTITDTTKPGVRRVLNLELPPTPGLYDLLTPYGTTLTVTANVTYTDRTTQALPMGVFDVDSEKSSEGGGGISITAPDKWVKIQRARFLGPKSSQLGWTVTAQITDLIRGALGATEPVVNNASSTAQVTALVWEKDRDKAIMDLAQSIGAWVYFDRNGVATIEDIPTIGASADWLVDSSASGVLIGLDRQRSRADTRNVVVVDSSAAGGAAFPTQFIWDDDPSSPTYAGTNPRTAPETAGPFGIVTYYYDTPLLTTSAAARQAGYTILSRVTGLASSVSLSQVPNPAVDAFDVIDVLPPRERYDITRVLERHVVDTVTHPLTLGSAQQIEGRATRTADIVGGS